VLASMNTLSTAFYMFWSIVFYNTTQAPNWRDGNIAMICMGVALFGNNFVAMWFERRDQEKEAVEVVEADHGKEIEA